MPTFLFIILCSICILHSNLILHLSFRIFACAVVALVKEVKVILLLVPNVGNASIRTV